MKKIGSISNKTKFKLSENKKLLLVLGNYNYSSVLSIIIINSFKIIPKNYYILLGWLQRRCMIFRKKKKVAFRKQQRVNITKPVLKILNTMKIISYKESNYIKTWKIFSHSIFKINKYRLLLANKYELDIIICIMRNKQKQFLMKKRKLCILKD